MAARVISGKAKGRRLKLVPGDTTRPIMDRVKESLFNILGEIDDTRWLDLFAGTGQVGIEALSRGATEVFFVDNSRVAIQTIRENLVHTGLSDGAVVLYTDAFNFLSGFKALPFDIIYVAPPQYKEMWVGVIKNIDSVATRYLNEDGLVVVQIDPREYVDLDLENLGLIDRRRYGNTLLCFYQE
ncbi:MAG: 16S rRNA (guanine(966)-N(2))-methyltransferase RsmD [Chloroflexota bacterium]